MELALLALTSIANLILAFSVASRSKGLTYYGRSFSVATFFIGMWGVATISLNEYTNMFWERILFSSALIALYFMTIFTFDYINKKSKLLIGILTCMSLILLILVWISTLIIVNVRKASNGGIDVELGSLIKLFTVFIILSLVILLRNLIIGLKTASPVKKLQLRYMVVGIILFVTPAFISNLLLPLLGIYNFNNLGVVFSISFTTAVTVSIIKHRLFSIRTLILKIIKTLFVGLILFIIVVTQRLFKEDLFGLGAFDPEALILDLFTAILVAEFIQEVFTVVERELGKMIKAEVVLLEDLTRTLDTNTSNTLDKKIVVNAVISILERAYPRALFNFVVIYGQKITVLPEDSQKIVISADLLNQVEDMYILQEDLEKNSFFEDKNIDIVARINMNLYLTARSDNTRELYSKTELDMLEEIISKLRDIFARVEVYEKTVRFNEELQNRVDGATSDLKQANQELQETLRKEKDMIDIFSHELRTPAGNASTAIQMIDLAANKPGIAKKTSLKSLKAILKEQLKI
ncbi:MAG: hypothetical protein Q9M91_02660 [Candidatus Dojkabacteria bacterium]|nr:hypothetical protein [Candidatus Dojkabacteria bacterium]